MHLPLHYGAWYILVDHRSIAGITFDITHIHTTYNGSHLSLNDPRSTRESNCAYTRGIAEILSNPHPSTISIGRSLTYIT